MTGLILQFAFTYTDDNRPKLNSFKEMQSLADHLVKQNTVEQFAEYADKHGLKRRNLMIQKSHHLLETHINSRIIYNIMNEQEWIKYLNRDDNAIKAALKAFYEKNVKK
jgi:carboxyl-terminal processing protease